MYVSTYVCTYGLFHVGTYSYRYDGTRLEGPEFGFSVSVSVRFISYSLFYVLTVDRYGIMECGFIY